jgi:hypothetical protein
MARKEIAAARFARSRIIKQRTCARCGEKKYSNETRVRDKAPRAESYWQTRFLRVMLNSLQPLNFCILITQLDGNVSQSTQTFLYVHAHI